MTVKLQHIFTPHPGKDSYTKEALFALAIEPEFVQEMADRLGLAFQESNSSAGRVCFANSPDVRPEFRTVFTEKDVVHYVSACLVKERFELALEEVPFPASVTAFWGGVL